MSKVSHFSHYRARLDAISMSIARFVRSNTFEWIFLLFLLTSASILRLYNIQETVMFLGDQGRDALLVSKIFREGDPIFIGPVTSVGNMYLGPLYYYFMLPWLWLTYPSPMGPVYGIALLGILTVFLTYWLGKRLFGKVIASFASVLIAFNVTAIFLSRFSWNPNPEPLVSVLWLYSLIRAFQGKVWHWVLVGVWLAVMLQLHYVTLILVGVTGLVWLFQAMLSAKTQTLRQLLLPSLCALGVILLFFTPLFLFDLKHDWLNAQSFINLVRGDDAFAVAQSLGSRFNMMMITMQSRLSQIMIDLLLGQTLTTGVLLSTLVLVAMGVFLLREKDKRITQAMLIVFLTIVMSILALSVYKNDVYIHYIAFLIPVICFAYAYVLQKLVYLNWTQWCIVASFFIFYIVGSVSQLRWDATGPTLRQLEEATNSIFERVDEGEKYALLLLSETKDTYGMNYRYFLSTDASKAPVDPEFLPQAETLIVIQEDASLQDPLSMPLYELLVFNVATPSATWKTLNGLQIYKLEKPQNNDVIGNDEESGI